MRKPLFPVFVVFLMLGIGGCGLVGWQGDARVDPLFKVEGTMNLQQVPNRGSVWTIEGDTATYVPRENIPSEVKKNGLRVSATGIVEEPPDFLSGPAYYLDLRSIANLEEE